MQITVLIEPITGGRFRARAGEPFSASAEGQSAEEARTELETLLRQQMKNGHLATIDLGNGAAEPGQAPLRLEPVADDDWIFQTMRETIAENRKRDDGAGP